jgi:hydrogenase maturation protease
MKPILIAGIGNVLRGDDGFGPLAVQTLAARHNFGPEIEIADLGTPGLELAGFLSCRRAVLLIDCICAEEPAGTTRIFNREDILAQQVPARSGSHEPSIAEALFALQLAGCAPAIVTLIGVAGHSFKFGDAMSDALLRAVDPTMELACDWLAQLKDTLPLN